MVRTIIAEICELLNGDGFAHTPRIVADTDFDLTDFNEQESSFSGVETEYVKQSGPGIAGDDFTGTMAVPLGDGHLFVIEYST